MALGAQRGSVLRLILGEAGGLAIAGIAIGLVAAVAISSFMRSLLFGVQSWDASTLAGVSMVLALSSLIASYLPARRAAVVNPIEALRYE
jgi:ABC-type antimicrobial peptide transport system permease subunit